MCYMLILGLQLKPEESKLFLCCKLLSKAMLVLKVFYYFTFLLLLFCYGFVSHIFLK